MTTLRRRDLDHVPAGDVWHWPRRPRWPQAWARALYCLALACAVWWAAGHLADALAGQGATWAALLAVGTAAAWAWMTRPAGTDTEPADEVWCWMPPDPEDARDANVSNHHRATPWRTQEGEAASARIVLDLGPWLLLRTRSGPQEPVVDRWVAADSLAGAWRWRFVHGGRHAVGLDASMWQGVLGAVRRSWYGAQVTSKNPSDSGFPATRILERPRAASRRPPR